MKCARCGAEMKSGCLYCEKCGEEIKIVPEFELEYEKQIHETLAQLAEDVSTQAEQNETKENDFHDFEEEDVDFHDNFKDILNFSSLHKNGKIRKRYIAAGILILCFFVSMMIIISKFMQLNSYQYQYEKAIAYADNHQMEEAIQSLKKALAINPENTDAQLLLAEYYENCGKNEQAILALQDLILKSPENVEEVYDILINLYLKQNSFSEIGYLLKKCNNDKILSKYNKFIAENPVFNKESGNYHEIISITLQGNTRGNVYYTLDGTDPDITSLKYENPILLENGKYTVKAVFVNTYGIQSDIVEKHYDISIEKPQAPTVNLESGIYNEPQLIEVYYETNAKVYYSLDGKEPTKDSLRYTEPIEMPVGVSNFKFVVINEQGAVSEITQKSYQLTMASYITPEMARQVLINNLQVDQVIVDQAGHIEGKLGNNIYEVRTAVKMNGAVYYILEESYIDTTGAVHETNHLYAIDAITGAPYTAVKTGEGQYMLNAL